MIPRFHGGDRVCFIGDSITAHNFYLQYVMRFYRDNYPDEHIDFYNCGISGAKCDAALMYMDEMILPHRPTHAIVMYGVNDSGRDRLANPTPENLAKLEERFRVYCETLPKVCDRLLAENISLILCTPMPYAEFEETGKEPLHGGYALISRYADFARAYANEHGIPLCDYHAVISEALKTEKLYNPDHIHPTLRGHYRMAECFLALQGLPIGEDKPFPESFAPWHEKVRIVRNVYAAEYMQLGGNGKPLDERMREMEDYVREERYNKTGAPDTFRFFATHYLTYRARLDELNAEVDRMMEQSEF